jgi:hypothetical protein
LPVILGSIIVDSNSKCFVLNVTLHFISQLERAAFASPKFSLFDPSMAKKDLYMTNKAASGGQQVALYMV